VKRAGRKPKPAPALSVRALALRVLGLVEDQGFFAKALMDDALLRQALNAADRRLLYELVPGVLRWQGRLDHYLAQVADRPVSKLDRITRRILRLGAYQLLMLDKIPASAAVNESVKLSRSYVRPYINAVLRELSRQKDQLALPGPEADSVARISIVESHPAWLVSRWIQELGEAEAEALCRANNLRPELTLRVNPWRQSREGLIKALAEAGIAAAPTLLSPLGVKVKDRVVPGELPGYDQGYFAVQDEASQLVGMLAGAGPGERVLDACAAPGTKSLQMALAMAGKGEVIAADANEQRLGLLEAEARRLGVEIVQAQRVDWTEPMDLGRFDRILVDAPCSGLGTLRRHPEIKWRLTPEKIAELAALQKKILTNVAKCLKPGATLVYSTCTFTREENAEVVETLLKSGEWDLNDAALLLPAAAGPAIAHGLLRTWPHRQGTDGFTATALFSKSIN
jgi:16S rRNA (cytosine967-C5)-methyltransferase